MPDIDMNNHGGQKVYGLYILDGSVVAKARPIEHFSGRGSITITTMMT